jgi:hypothetical protein
MITAIYTGPERVECRGAEHTGPNAEGDLARALVFSRNGVPALAAALALLEVGGLL